MNDQKIFKAIEKGIKKALFENNIFYYKGLVGKPYYSVGKPFFLKKGYELKKDESQTFEDKGYGIAIFDNGCSRVEMKCEIFRNKNTGNLNCGNILEIKQNDYD